MKTLLIVYYSVHGGTYHLAEHLAKGAMEQGVDVKLRTVPNVYSVSEKVSKDEMIKKEEMTLEVSLDDVSTCDGLLIGSPTRFGNMAAPMKYFIDKLMNQWINHELVGKPSGVFCSTASLHGGQEATLLSMMIPLMHLGTVLVSFPYKFHELSHTRTGGTPYGPSHWSENNKVHELFEEEKILCYQYAQHFVSVMNKLS
jgi:NAD(P)H dehydrogenase (quinone)